MDSNSQNPLLWSPDTSFKNLEISCPQKNIQKNQNTTQTLNFIHDGKNARTIKTNCETLPLHLIIIC